MRNTIGLFFLIASVNLIGQVNVSEEFDEFEKIKDITAFIGKGRWPRMRDRPDKHKEINFSLSYLEKDDVRLLSFTMMFFSHRPIYCLSEYDGKAIFLLKDGQTVECRQTSDTDCSRDYPSAVYTFYPKEVKEPQRAFEISKEALEKISAIGISKIRVHTTEVGAVDFEIKEDRTDFVKQCYEAILERLD